MENVLYRAPHIDHLGLDFFTAGYGVAGDGQHSGFTLHADVTGVPLPSGCADGIAIMHVLEHVPDLDKGLKEL
jgi:hypothetical protein